jgi:hypothetical protein
MDKPEFKIRAKVSQQSLALVDDNQVELNALCDTRWTLGEQDRATEIKIEVVRPESSTVSRVRLTRVFSPSEIALFLTAIDKVLRLVQTREHMGQRPPTQGIEFSIDIFDNLKIGAVESPTAEPSYFIKLSAEEDAVRFRLKTVDELERLRNIFQAAT